jgi:hypothetical protein
MKKKILMGITFFAICVAGTLLLKKDVVDPVSEIKNETDIKSELIRIFNPVFGEKISSPLKISGEARGTWFFEASFPIFLVDWDGKIIAQGIATAKGDWMTENFVPFEAELTFEKPSYGERGAIILKKDNPSGLSENDDAIEISILF